MAVERRKEGKNDERNDESDEERRRDRKKKRKRGENELSLAFIEHGWMVNTAMRIRIRDGRLKNWPKFASFYFSLIFNSSCPLFPSVSFAVLLLL